MRAESWSNVRVDTRYRNFLKLKVVRDLEAGRKSNMYTLINRALEEVYGKELRSYLKHLKLKEKEKGEGKGEGKGIIPN